jgi:DNA replication protein DnaC
MNCQDFIRSQALNNIPKKKIQERISFIENSNDLSSDKYIKLIAINRYAESNIPIQYWDLKMEKNFKGDPRLFTKYNSYIDDLKNAYINGTSICLAGPHGVGKTFVLTSILKMACLKGFTCLYSDLSNIISVLTQASTEEKFLAKKELFLVDFLGVDEVDPRFFTSSENTNELFAKNFENIIRTRIQNNLPTIICTNSPNMLESFTGLLKESLSSLFSKIDFFPIFGQDYRKSTRGI